VERALRSFKKLIENDYEEELDKGKEVAEWKAWERWALSAVEACNSTTKADNETIIYTGLVGGKGYPSLMEPQVHVFGAKLGEEVAQSFTKIEKYYWPHGTRAENDFWFKDTKGKEGKRLSLEELPKSLLGAARVVELYAASLYLWHNARKKPKFVSTAFGLKPADFELRKTKQPAEPPTSNSGTDKTAQPSGTDKTAQASGKDNTAKPSGKDNTPKPSGKDNTPKPSGTDKSAVTAE
jgi:hypothetical protein